jgi:hypothetical protein
MTSLTKLALLVAFRNEDALEMSEQAAGELS